MTMLSSFLPRGLVPLSMMTMRESTTLNYSEDRFALVVLVGGGGGGGAGRGNDSWTDFGGAGQGGNGGGIAVQLVRFQAGVNYTFSVGSGGAGAAPAEGVAGTGSDGGNTTLTSTALSTITANGGKGGQAISVRLDSATYGGGALACRDDDEEVAIGAPGGRDRERAAVLRGSVATPDGGASHRMPLPPARAASDMGRPTRRLAPGRTACADRWGCRTRSCRSPR